MSLNQIVSLSQEWENVPERLVVEDELPSDGVCSEWSYVDLVEETKAKPTIWSSFSNASLQGLVLPRASRTRASRRADQESTNSDSTGETSTSTTQENQKALRQQIFHRSKEVNGRASRFNSDDQQLLKTGSLEAKQNIAIKSDCHDSLDLQAGVPYSLNKDRRWVHVDRLLNSQAFRAKPVRGVQGQPTVTLSRATVQQLQPQLGEAKQQYRICKSRKGTVTKPVRTPGKKGVKRSTVEPRSSPEVLVRVEAPATKGKYPHRYPRQPVNKPQRDTKTAKRQQAFRTIKESM